MTVDIRIGDALAVLRAMPDASVHCVITSPPYWGLRAYGGDPDMIGLDPTFPSAPFRGAHFATFPPALVEPCIRAGTSEHGVCPNCGAPWGRVINKTATGRVRDRSGAGLGAAQSRETHALPAMTGTFQEGVIGETVGWRPSCACYDERYRAEHPEPRCPRKRRQRAAWAGRWQRVRARPGNPEWPTSPAIVLDPFAGAGTAGLVAERLGRDSILIEINPTYAAMARSRINVDASRFTRMQAAE